MQRVHHEVCKLYSVSFYVDPNNVQHGLQEWHIPQLALLPPDRLLSPPFTLAQHTFQTELFAHGYGDQAERRDPGAAGDADEQGPAVSMFLGLLTTPVYGQVARVARQFRLRHASSGLAMETAVGECEMTETPNRQQPHCVKWTGPPRLVPRRLVLELVPAAPFTIEVDVEILWPIQPRHSVESLPPVPSGTLFDDLRLFWLAAQETTLQRAVSEQQRRSTRSDDGERKKTVPVDHAHEDSMALTPDMIVLCQATSRPRPLVVSDTSKAKTSLVETKSKLPSPLTSSALSALSASSAPSLLSCTSPSVVSSPPLAKLFAHRILAHVRAPRLWDPAFHEQVGATLQWDSSHVSAENASWCGSSSSSSSADAQAAALSKTETKKPPFFAIANVPDSSAAPSRMLQLTLPRFDATTVGWLLHYIYCDELPDDIVAQAYSTLREQLVQRRPRRLGEAAAAVPEPAPLANDGTPLAIAIVAIARGAEDEAPEAEPAAEDVEVEQHAVGGERDRDDEEADEREGHHGDHGGHGDHADADAAGAAVPVTTAASPSDGDHDSSDGKVRFLIRFFQTLTSCAQYQYRCTKTDNNNNANAKAVMHLASPNPNRSLATRHKLGQD